MKPLQLKDRWVLVTGASSGLGREMALELARRHEANPILVARREDRLVGLARELEDFGVKSEILVADLAQVSEAERVFKEATTRRDVFGAILNAGVTHFGKHDELSWERFEQMLSLNVTSTVRLSSLLLEYFESRGDQRGLMLVSSMAGLTPVAYQTAYSATKAFLVHYGCGLHHEMLPRGVSVTTFAPGGIVTEMTAGERFNDLRGWLMPADKCAREAIDAYVARRYLHVPGMVMRWGSVLTKLIPQRFLVGRVAEQYRKSLEANG